ncbi:hypothetical protein ASPVEDRAFT_741919 [Aspergillus versicolor CBS 583.65]|uniref:Uncharacterized protein n=1 Tax=Aspergillus versicolor CBS 583.65 TaxID=1036611 RepID=A0A1L9PQ41_ASPVE|nr:uncharacterized protein ASPVEDRAFT_741919 [Aspergillus versicolor CBS 583.65]OJJ03613.1 hypothetical protein ASPVEDRAFT_741919 [Aspergillus versicolor CBS 583.65]
MAPPCLSGEPQLLIHRRRNNPDHPTDISDRYRTSETGRAKSQSSTLTRGVGFCSHPTLPIRLLIGVYSWVLEKRRDSIHRPFFFAICATRTCFLTCRALVNRRDFITTPPPGLICYNSAISSPSSPAWRRSEDRPAELETGFCRGRHRT